MGRGKLDNIKQDETVAIIDALTDQDAGILGKTILYRGRAAAFDTNDDGTLRHIRLVEVMRGSFENSKPWGKPKFVLKLVPGNVFVIDYSRVRNLNISYITKAAYFSAIAQLQSTDAPFPVNRQASPRAQVP
jgi:anaerobic ribonucleoside-triphosphate reductase